MSCCCRVNTDIILANLLSKVKDKLSFTFSDIEGYYNYLAEEIPTYVVTDLSIDSVRDCVQKYPEIFDTDSNGNIIPGEYEINTNHFNTIYPESIASFIERTTKHYIETKKW